MHRSAARLAGVTLLLAAFTAVLAAAAASRTSVAPENLLAPHVKGTAKEGATLTASPGGWADGPTSFIYRWQRCGTDGRFCTRDLQLGSSKTYVVKRADAGHTIRVVVTAVNADGRGRMTVTLQAIDKSRKTSAIRGRSIHHP